ncbi:hypothetical protein CVP04_01430 [Caviibacterium pharyngocola]|uniref:DUF2681 domain-containing protein n=2 Tax=Caviibacterium pharyngocola TaxID=28159 RepID=A0A2M8RYJ3_9PAST|nr:DUF2681 domain-containing protein [Caviibacterium pharyngocola]PJG83955.1 hypothetical protein CVP04_01430 [Caviibacterium pharyngocola]
MTYVFVVGFVLVVILLSYAGYKIKRANNEIDRLFKTNEQLQTEKIIAQTQVKNLTVRKQYEENSHNADRTAVIDRLQQSADLRD